MRKITKNELEDSLKLPLDKMIDSNNELIPASNNAIGFVRPDGTSIVIDSEGTISVSPTALPEYVLPIATDTILGGVKVDGESITINEDGVIKSEGYYNVAPPPEVASTFSNVALFEQMVANEAPARRIGTTIYLITKDKYPAYFNRIMNLIIARNIIMDMEPDTIKVNLFMSPPEQVLLFIAEFELFAGTIPMQEVIFANATESNDTGWSLAELKGGMRDYTVNLFEFTPANTPLEVMQGSTISYIDTPSIIEEWRVLIGKNNFNRAIVENFKSPKRYRNDTTSPRFTLQMVSTYEDGLRREKYYRTSLDNTNWSSIALFDNHTELEDLIEQVDTIKTDLSEHINKVASTTELGHVKVDGVTITSTNGVISAITPPSTSGDYRIDDTKTLVSFFNTYEQGTTVTELPKDGSHQATTSVINAYLGWTVAPIAYTLEYVLTTFVDGTIGRQELYAYFKTTEGYYLVGHLTRGTNSTAVGWSAKWSSNVIVLNDIPNGSYAHFGMYGMIKSDPATGKLYRCTSKTIPQQYSWIEIGSNLELTNNLTTSTTGTALDASQGKVLNDQFNTLTGEVSQNLVTLLLLRERLDNHETKVASTTELGHVKVDGTSIVADASGIISAVANGSANMITITEEELFSANLHTNGIFFVERTIGKLPPDVESAFVKVVMHDTSAPNIKGKNYFVMGLVFGEGETTAPTYWGFQDVDISVPENIDELNYWMPTGGTELIPKFDNHIKTKASTTELGHVKVDGTSITMDTNGVISVDLSGLNGFDVVDNFNSTSSTDALSAGKGKEVYDLAVAHTSKLATVTALGHVKLSNQWDNPLTDTALSLEGSTNLASAFSNEIEILNNELLSTNGQVQNAINKINTHVNKVGSTTELGHFKVDGTTITSNIDGVLSAIIPESTETYTFDDSKHINTGKDYFIDGVTITKIPKLTNYHQSVTNLLNTQLGWTAVPTGYAFDYVLHTSKNGVSGMQTLYVYYYNLEHYYLMGKLTRTTAGTSLGWSLKWTAETVVFNHVPTANAEPLGMFGMLKFDTSTGKLYKSTAKTTPQPNSWFEVEPKMVNSLNQAVQGYALDASQGYILKGLIDNHTTAIASNTKLGHVKVDGNSIEIDANGVIGINTENFRATKWYIGTDRFGITDAIYGDYYLDTTDGKIYQYADNVWEDLGGSLIPQGYKLQHDYYRESLPATELDVSFQVLSTAFLNTTVEVYDEGLALVPNLDYTMNYDNVNQELTVTLKTARTHSTQITIKLIKVVKL